MLTEVFFFVLFFFLYNTEWEEMPKVEPEFAFSLCPNCTVSCISYEDVSMLCKQAGTALRVLCWI